jgi:membrane protease YdiL (CAAX protease family)
MAARKSKSDSKTPFGGRELDVYLEQSQRPLVILLYLMPFVLLYEAGARFYRVDVVAYKLFRELPAWFGIYGRGVPAALLVLTLFIWHLAIRDRWRFQLRVLMWMLLESALLALPVLAIAILTRRYIPAAASSHQPAAALWSISLGAGVYEELMFRFYGCGLLQLIAQKAFGLKGLACTIAVALVSSILFSLYHYLGDEPFSLFTFVFRTLAGAFFATLFMYRGLGITAGSHAIYDLIVVTVGQL